MSIAAQPTSRVTHWPFVVIGAVALLAAGIGVALGAFLLTARSAGVGAAAAYVPADAILYAELHVRPSTTQDAGLRELLGYFPAIEDLDLDQPLYDQLIERIDEELAGEDTDLRWSSDVAPWFDGTVAFAVTDIPAAAMAPLPMDGPPMDPMQPFPVPELPGGVVMFGVTDASAAEAAVERLLSEVDEGVTFTETDHDGITIHAGEADAPGAWALTSDQLIFGFGADDIVTALDARDGETLADAERTDRLLASLPSDRLGLVVYDYTDVMAEALAQGGEASAISDALAGVVEAQPLRGAATISMGGDRISFDAASEPPGGDFAVTNADRGLADEVPADALYYSEGGNIGAALTAIIGPLKEAAAEEPEAADQIETAEAALGGEIEELVSWIGDGAMVVGADGTTPYAGLVLVPTDADAADRRLGQLATFAGLAGMDPSSGVSVDESEVAGETVTTIRWEPAAGDPMLGMPFGVVVQFTVTDDRAVIGFGDGFVARVLELDPADSLGASQRFADAVADMGGRSNTGVTWLDLAGAREAIEAAIGTGDDADYSEVRPWLMPLDAIVSVARLEDDVLVQHGALLVGE